MNRIARGVTGMNQINGRRLLRIALVVTLVIALYQLATVWLRFQLMYPSEQQFGSVTSPDGERVAHFSVRYEGRYPWWPANPKPHFYITITDAASGRVLLRETDFDWDYEGAYGSTSFIDLAEAYAPWSAWLFQPKVPSPNT
jgi:hypothetical protein